MNTDVSKTNHRGTLKDKLPELSEIQRAKVSIMVTKNSGLKAEAEITSGGLLAISVLVSSILLSTAVIVHVSTRHLRPRRPWRR